MLNLLNVLSVKCQYDTQMETCGRYQINIGDIRLISQVGFALSDACYSVTNTIIKATL